VDSVFDFSKAITGAVNLDALFSVDTYTVSYFEGETLLLTESAVYGASLEYPPLRVQEGMIFKGFIDSEGNLVEEGTLIENALTLTALFEKAVYKINTYTIEFLNESSDLITSYSIEYNAPLNDVTIPEAPVKENYTFTG